jgi:hypothetical protein
MNTFDKIKSYQLNEFTGLTWGEMSISTGNVFVPTTLDIVNPKIIQYNSIKYIDLYNIEVKF